ncbi:hypothetical protein HYPBUDRAFT_102333 [Hyphopichia burtonii NRRL Y-1933]|uniref:Splicing factor subunit n=1 Tax=Hyphopichia burtonii NRRL Y-1933 TaxID=984485 RepID=A0A1E4RR69_9ASCO|nr:hypothetical protein HYPBUDRAFT_102333 [Hyphopichia burtonii NRRL Y-1933]ODV69752.1 hypothetical protein HYPBUDRAFT_102333 [Hyphopichia burtonii NRRL Y-1933]
MADKQRDINLYNLQRSKYLSVGDPNTSRNEFVTSIKRDTYSSLAQHDNLLLYNSVALNRPMELTRIEMIKKMVSPLDK